MARADSRVGTGKLSTGPGIRRVSARRKGLRRHPRSRAQKFRCADGGPPKTPPKKRFREISEKTPRSGACRRYQRTADPSAAGIVRVTIHIGSALSGPGSTKMKIVCLGGGPAGLYFSILAKKANPSWDITVIERNPPDSTFGWGVVFSDKTMGGFQEADPETHASITQAFRHWDDIDVHFRGRKITSSGHGFCGIARMKLLQI